MAGSISLSLSQRFDRNGAPLAGGKLYFYAASTTTPQNAYRDTGLTSAHPNPITLDAYGNVPEFYLADGNIHVRLTDSTGTVVLDAQNVLVIGPSSGDGGGGSPVDPTKLLQTGFPLWVPFSGTWDGLVRMNARTIGSATSGASERANPDTALLYTFLWTNFSNTLCPVTGGRGVSAAADFAANKPIQLLDMRGRGAFGLPDMGNSDGGAFSGITFGTGAATTAGSTAGAALATILQANLPNFNMPATATFNHNIPTFDTGGIGALQGGLDLSFNLATPTSFNVNSGGSGTQLDKLSPLMVGTWYQVL